MPAGDHLFVISGCSGGGKSTLLSELERRGFSTVAEPGRAIVKEQLCSGGTALPWEDDRGVHGTGVCTIGRGLGETC